MTRPLYVRIVSCMLAVIFPAALFAADAAPAMLYSHGTAMLNGNNIARSSAIFSGDLVQTSRDSVANINATGSSVLILNESLVQYEGSAVKLEHGGVTVSTSKLLATRVGGVTVTPRAGVWTEFDVKDVDGKVEIAARKGDLTISDAKGTTLLAQGQQSTREESPSQDDSQGQNDNNKKKKKKGGGAPGPTAGASGGVFNSPIAIGVAGGLIIGGTAWALSGHEDPVSPSKP